MSTDATTIPTYCPGEWRWARLLPSWPALSCGDNTACFVATVEMGHAQLTQPPSVDRLDVEPATTALLANGHDVKSLAR